jgi:hypothetical protein
MSKPGMTRRSLHILSSPFAVFMILVAVCIGLLSCENPTGTPKGNSFPDTRLANLPPNDTIAQYITRGCYPRTISLLVVMIQMGISSHIITTDDVRRTGHLPREIRCDPEYHRGRRDCSGHAGNPSRAGRGKTRAPGSLYRIYNFMATLDPTNLELRNKIDDSLGTGRIFAVPYPTGAIVGIPPGADPLISETPTKGVFIFDSPPTVISTSLRCQRSTTMKRRTRPRPL